MTKSEEAFHSIFRFAETEKFAWDKDNKEGENE